MQFQPDIHGILHPLTGMQHSWVMEQLFLLSDAQQQEIYFKLIQFVQFLRSLSSWKLVGRNASASSLSQTQPYAVHQSRLLNRKSQATNEDGLAADAAQPVLQTLTTFHPHKGHSSLPEKGTMPQRGHSTGCSGMYVLGGITHWPSCSAKSQQTPALSYMYATHRWPNVLSCELHNKIFGQGKTNT